MAASKTALLLLMCLPLWGNVHFVHLSVIEEQNGFMMAGVGDNVTLHCFDQDNYKGYYWYQQRFGHKPELLASRTKYNEGTIMHEPSKNDPRFSVVSGERINHLTISDVRVSDSAMYYCGMQKYTDIQFKEGIMLHVKGSSSSIQAIVQKPPEKQPGDSVNLNCSVHTTGTYHCAVASGGDTVGGDAEQQDCCHQMRILVFLSISRTGVVLCFVLILTVVYMSKKYTCYVEERQ